MSAVWLPKLMQKLSHTDLPAISAPASRSRVTTVASLLGTNPSITFEPFIIGRPATQTLSLMAIFLPANGPLGAPLMDAVTYQAPSGFSEAGGRVDSRGPYFGGAGWLRGFRHPIRALQEIGGVRMDGLEFGIGEFEPERLRVLPNSSSVG